MENKYEQRHSCKPNPLTSNWKQTMREITGHKNDKLFTRKRIHTAYNPCCLLDGNINTEGSQYPDMTEEITLISFTLARGLLRLTRSAEFAGFTNTRNLSTSTWSCDKSFIWTS